jgi:AAA+ ATPase superfamily predicted ATPase
MNDEIKDLIPKMNVNLPEIPEQEQCLIEDETLLGIYDEIIKNLKEDRQQIDECFVEFKEMVINGGDASTSSKEALVNLLKIKTETTDKMSKVADLMTRIKLKSPDTYKPYLSASQSNKTTINITSDKRKLLKTIAAAAKKTKEEENDK